MRAILCVLFLSACATAQSAAPGAATALDAQSCSPLATAVADRGTTLYAKPDSTSEPVTTLRTDTRVCVSSSTSGFGFRRIRLGDGREAYAPEDHVSEL